MNKEDFELLSPAQDFTCLKTAIQNGANSVYFGGPSFNARASATNFTKETMKQAIEYAKLRNVKTHLTLNILTKNEEIQNAIDLASYAIFCGIDAIIIQDLGLAKLLMKGFPNFPFHASTQMTVHNLEGVLELAKLGFKRAVLAREVPINEIEYICQNSPIEIEVFIHGALCVSYSGQCLFSSMVGARSGNRGKCAGPCRLPYKLIDSNKHIVDSGYILSPKDLCGINFIPRLINAGVKCFKIEGRLKPSQYVGIVTKIYRKYIDMFFEFPEKSIELDENDKLDLLQAFNRSRIFRWSSFYKSK